MSFDSRAFRNALGCFPTGVTVVTTLDGNGAPLGVTVSSFTSVSLSPPLVLFCLDDKNSWIEEFERNGHFAINVLSEDQQDLSVRFSGRMADKWAGVAFERWTSGVPILPSCQANFECSVTATHDGGDHRIFVGTVERMRHLPAGRPLVYSRGNYAKLGDGES
ncbi:flavin reductase family protein [Telmatospirillum sp.]|uniref:flavin reductase family protein n=1 Tax=Telmatospirillum sp. TaxID=2079197 RepID=UPI00284B4725|nr:flavin reductase family protein [Telmatospirillum sp.]MDR3440818.1 flavin reductase family protein [Telmatospirillum sp.]